jgi:hypothetical protein
MPMKRRDYHADNADAAAINANDTRSGGLALEWASKILTQEETTKGETKHAKQLPSSDRLPAGHGPHGQDKVWGGTDVLPLP